VYNPNLGSYWDLEHCGKASDNHNADWCGGVAEGDPGLPQKCMQSVVVDTALCASGEAVLRFTKEFAPVDGCSFAYYTQYVCKLVGDQ